MFAYEYNCLLCGEDHTKVVSCGGVTMCALDREFNQYLREADQVDGIKRIGHIERITGHTIGEWLLVIFMCFAALC